MVLPHLLSAPPCLLEKIPSLLNDHGIQFVDLTKPTIASIELELQCSYRNGTVTLAVERRRDPSARFSVVLHPHSRGLFRRNPDSQVLLDQLKAILLSEGASDEPESFTASWSRERRKLNQSHES